MFVQRHLSLVFASCVSPQLNSDFLVPFVQSLHLLRSIEEILGVFRDIFRQLREVDEVLVNVCFHMSKWVSFVILLEHVFVYF